MVEETEHTSLGKMKVLGQAVNVTGNDDNWLRHPPPLLGEHSREILSEIGFDDRHIAEMIAGEQAAQWNSPDSSHKR